MNTIKKVLIALSIALMVTAGGQLAFAADGDPVLLPGDTGITITGTIATGTWGATDVGAAHGGTGASTLTDGGILLGSGVGAVTPMGVLADGSIVVGDGATDPVALVAFTSSTGVLKHERGGLELDISGWTNNIPMVNGGTTSALTFYDEDTMVTDSATGVASQQSIKAYVDAEVAGASTSWGAIEAKTVATGAITTGGDILMSIAGEGATTDAVTSIDGAAVGDVLLFKGVPALAYTITFTDDNSVLDLQANFLMDNQNDILCLLCIAVGTPDTFIELSRASNG